MLTAEQREEFDRSGIMRLPGAIAPSKLQVMLDFVWDAVERRTDVRRDDLHTWKGQRVMGTQDLPASATFEQIGSAAVCDALDRLFGRRKWQRPERWASMLVTFPESTAKWNVPHIAWHLDFPASRDLEGLFAARLFVCLARLQRGGGGTVFVEGSHRLVQNLVKDSVARQIRSADARKALIRSHPWIKRLCSFDEGLDRVRLFMKAGAMIDGVELRVVEMTGEAGDVLITHPLLLHAPATNCSEFPRIVLSSTVYRCGVAPNSIYN
jgi:Phytanoyl-CoA dioxygenase (PhyH)